VNITIGKGNENRRGRGKGKGLPGGIAPPMLNICPGIHSKLLTASLYPPCTSPSAMGTRIPTSALRPHLRKVIRVGKGEAEETKNAKTCHNTIMP
jgi:hypothetical protein